MQIELGRAGEELMVSVSSNRLVTPLQVFETMTTEQRQQLATYDQNPVAYVRAEEPEAGWRRTEAWFFTPKGA